MVQNQNGGERLSGARATLTLKPPDAGKLAARRRSSATNRSPGLRGPASTNNSRRSSPQPGMRTHSPSGRELPKLKRYPSESSVNDYVVEEIVRSPARIHLIHEPECKFSIELLELFRKEIPTAKISDEVGDAFCLYVNNKIVYNKTLLKRFPRMDEMVEICHWMNEGKTFMHLYLCSFAEGGEPKMVIDDRRNTPFAKRLILMCTIQ